MQSIKFQIDLYTVLCFVSLRYLISPSPHFFYFIISFVLFQAEEQLKLVEEQRKILEEKQRMEEEERKRVKQEQDRILNKKNARPKLSFSLGK